MFPLGGIAIFTCGFIHLVLIHVLLNTITETSRLETHILNIQLGTDSYVYYCWNFAVKLVMSFADERVGLHMTSTANLT